MIILSEMATGGLIVKTADYYLKTFFLIERVEN